MTASNSWDGLAPLVAAVHRLERRAEEQERRLAAAVEAARLAHDDDRTLRRELRAARERPAYAEPFEQERPLVSVIVATWDDAEALAGRSLPSALAQTWEELEVVVVGDGSPPAVEEAVRSFGDPRIRFHNLSMRGPYPSDPHAAWLSAGTSCYNAAAALARGAWLAPLADDDAFTPTHVETLLEHARARRLEFVYGRFLRQATGGYSPELLGSFPPELGQVALQAALYHRDLRIFEVEWGDAVFGVPNDWGMIRRMLRAGVRVGMVDEVVCEYFPSPRNVRVRETAAAPPDAASLLQGLAQQAAALERRALDAEQRAQAAEVRLGEAERRAADAERHAADTERQLDVVYGSSSWRLTRPLRAAGRLRRR